MDIQNPDIKRILQLYKEIALLSSINAILGWDLNVNLPAKAAAERGMQSAYITQLVTKKWHEPEFKQLIEKVNTAKNLTEQEKAIVRNLNHGAHYFYNVPQEIIIEKSRVANEAFVAWREAKADNNTKKFLPHFKKIIDLNRQVAKHLGYKDNPYDALLDLFEPGITAKEIKVLFDEVKQALVPLIKNVQKSKAYPDTLPFIQGEMTYPPKEQERFAKYVLKQMGYDFAAGRVDVSPHPFTTELSRHDIRVTTKYADTDFRDSLTASMHEGGHALYEQGINEAFTDTPLAGGVSLGIHEALSRFWENMVGRSPAFLSYVTPLFQSFYPDELGNVSSEALTKAFNLVKPSFIRIEADEVTYSLHIIIRFEMENEILNGKIDAKDAEVAWNEKYKKYLGITVNKPSNGVLQDVHWAYGEFGYFPAYALGNLYGAQILAAMKKDLAFDEEIGKGNLLPVKQWLDEHVHQYGSMYFPKDLVRKATGKPLQPKYFIDYLTKKYSVLYPNTK